jgi:hypothetical protein
MNLWEMGHVLPCHNRISENTKVARKGVSINNFLLILSMQKVYLVPGIVF